MEPQAPSALVTNELGLIEAEDMAHTLQVTVQTLANWRSLGMGPAYVRVHGNRICYQVEDLKAWLADRTVRPKAQPTLINGQTKRGRPANREIQK